MARGDDKVEVRLNGYVDSKGHVWLEASALELAFRRANNEHAADVIAESAEDFIKNPRKRDVIP